jgi:hypothetical protein
MLLPLVFALQQAQSPIARVVVTPAPATVRVGDTLRFTARALDANGQPVANAQIRYQANAIEHVADLDSMGIAVGIVPGRFPVVAVAMVPGSRPVVQRFEVRVVPSLAARITVTPKIGKLVAGQRLLLQTSAISAQNDPAIDQVTWSSSAPTVARVLEGGVLEAVGPGSATITARAGRATTPIPVTVLAASAVTRLEVTPGQPQARQGDVVRFAATARGTGGATVAGVTPSWSVSPGTAVIDAEGVFVGYEAGTYVVTANVGGQSADARVTLAPRDVRRKATVLGSVIRGEFPSSEVWVHPNGRVAYLGAGPGGDRLYTIDISDPTKPTIVDSVMANSRHTNDLMTDAAGKILVFTRENAADRKNGIVICTLDDPLHPKVVSEFTDGVTAGVHSAFVYTQPRFGTHVYLTNDGTGAIHVIDVNDPAKPKQVAVWKTPRADAGRYVHDIDVQDGLLYGSYWNDGLVILDIGRGIKNGSPSNPTFVSQFKYDLDKMYSELGVQHGADFLRGTHTAWRHKNYVFIGDEVFSMPDIQQVLNGQAGQGFGNLQVIDVSDIEHPKSVAWYKPEFGGVHNVWVAGDTLYMGAYNGGFRAFDISGELRGDLRAQGREIAHVNTVSAKGKVPNAAMTWGAVVKNNLIFVNDYNSGLFIVRLERKPEVVP